MKLLVIALATASLSAPAWAQDHSTSAGPSASAGGAAVPPSSPAPQMMDMGGMDMNAMMDRCHKMAASSDRPGDPASARMRRDCEAMMKNHDREEQTATQQKH
jgi:hypothetical protein